MLLRLAFVSLLPILILASCKKKQKKLQFLIDHKGQIYFYYNSGKQEFTRV